MKLTTRAPRLLIAAAAVGCSAILVPSAAFAATAATAAHAALARPAASRFRQCTSGRTQVWIGLPSNGAAGTNFYQLEFSNIGRTTCWLFGYPGVSAFSSAGRQIGPAASHHGRRHLVVLTPGSTAHAVLGITRASNIAGCKIRTAAGLKVFPPGQFIPGHITGFSFKACSNKRVLSTGPVRPGVGIP